jgi:outer membrane receptor for ferrienterochelin and colicin
MLRMRIRLPDVNTAEAIRRVPGISLETDTGEGRYINIRGLDADLTNTALKLTEGPGDNRVIQREVITAA